MKWTEKKNYFRIYTRPLTLHVQIYISTFPTLQRGQRDTIIFYINISLHEIDPYLIPFNFRINFYFSELFAFTVVF